MNWLETLERTMSVGVTSPRCRQMTSSRSETRATAVVREAIDVQAWPTEYKRRASLALYNLWYKFPYVQHSTQFNYKTQRHYHNAFDRSITYNTILQYYNINWVLVERLVQQIHNTKKTNKNKTYKEDRHRNVNSFIGLKITKNDLQKFHVV